MFNLKRLMTGTDGPPNPQHFPDSDFQSTENSSCALELQYKELIDNQLRRFGIDRKCISLEVRKVGESSDGLDVFAGMVRILRWERVSALRLLLGLPMLETKVRHAVNATWLVDVSHFSGLWMNTSHDLHCAHGISELRDLIVQLAPPRKAQSVPHATSTQTYQESALTNP